MKIAVLGWGSLIWDPRDLAISGEWLQGGPVLPIEFSRISNNGRLTLVIDEVHGARVPTRYALSSCADLETAIANLQKREGAPTPATIGFVDLPRNAISARAQSQHPNACADIQIWARTTAFDAAIWTAIGPRFRDRAGEPFSVDAAIRYLSSLQGEPRNLAFEYIRKAPAEIMTSVRAEAQALIG